MDKKIYGILQCKVLLYWMDIFNITMQTKGQDRQHNDQRKKKLRVTDKTLHIELKLEQHELH